MRRFVAWLLILACAPTGAAITDLPGIPQVRIEVSRSGDTWNADFTFDRRFTAWVFRRSDLTRKTRREWRQQGWTVTTPGVRLQRRGNFDVLTAPSGELPRRVSVRFEPEPDSLEQDHPPALIFTDGSVALFIGQFDGFPLDSLAEVRKLPADLNNHPVPAAHTRFLFRDAAGPVLLDGKRAAPAQTSESDSYVLFGASRPVETPDMIGIFDPQLPAWIRDSLTRAVPALLARYTQELGPLQGFKPALMVTWEGATPGFVSREGSTLRGLIAMRYEGAVMLEESDWQRQIGLWFIAHEAAHFWLGQTIAYEYARDAWITEGGAELLAFRAVAEADPTYDPRIALNRALEDCIRLSKDRGVESAGLQDDRRAYYACGAIFSLVAEAGSGRSFYKFARTLLDASRADGVISRSEWLAALDAATRKPELSRDIARLLDRGVPDPGEFITDLLVRAGADVEIGPGGAARLR